MNDLLNGMVRTPLEPRVTFLDDPIRVLRAIRFCSRFNFTLDEALSKGMDDDDVRDALMKKVSRERVSIELMGMITGTAAHPSRALSLLHDHDLLRCVFSPLNDPCIVVLGQGENENEIISKGKAASLILDKPLWERAHASVKNMHHLMLVQMKDRSFSDEDVRLHILSAVLLPMSAMYFNNQKKNKLVHLPDLVLREALKVNNNRSHHIRHNFYTFSCLLVMS